MNSFLSLYISTSYSPLSLSPSLSYSALETFCIYITLHSLRWWERGIPVSLDTVLLLPPGEEEEDTLHTNTHTHMHTLTCQPDFISNRCAHTHTHTPFALCVAVSSLTHGRLKKSMQPIDFNTISPAEDHGIWVFIWPLLAFKIVSHCLWCFVTLAQKKKKKICSATLRRRIKFHLRADPELLLPSFSPVCRLYVNTTSLKDFLGPKPEFSLICLKVFLPH